MIPPAPGEGLPVRIDDQAVEVDAALAQRSEIGGRKVTPDDRHEANRVGEIPGGEGDVRRAAAQHLLGRFKRRLDDVKGDRADS
jgi:hypothetical protein